jgi:hypothetical protein
MPILSASEFEAVINNVRMRSEKVITERGSIPVLESAVRDLQTIFQAARQPAKLKGHRKLLDQVTDVLTKEIPDDNALLDQLWDLADFIDYRT